MEILKVKLNAGRKFVYIPLHSELEVGDYVLIKKLNIEADDKTTKLSTSAPILSNNAG